MGKKEKKEKEKEMKAKEKKEKKREGKVSKKKKTKDEASPEPVADTDESSAVGRDSAKDIILPTGTVSDIEDNVEPLTEIIPESEGGVGLITGREPKFDKKE